MTTPRPNQRGDEKYRDERIPGIGTYPSPTDPPPPKRDEDEKVEKKDSEPTKP